MRDLGERAVDPQTNGRVALEDYPEPTSPMLQSMTVRRDKHLAEMAMMLIHTAEMLDPLIALFSRWSLRWAALGLLAWLSHYALVQPSWERLAIVGAFSLGSSLIWWKA